MNSHTHTHTAEWPIAKKLNYAKGKLSLIPAFGDSIGKEVNKAELGLCMAMISSAEASHADLIEALEAILEPIDAPGGTIRSITWQSIAQARAALEKAKGTP